MTDKPKAEIITPPNPLRDRIALGSPTKSELLEAERAIERLSCDFLRRIQDDCRTIETAFAALKARPDDAACKAELYKQTCWLKGEASTFDYMLLSNIGEDLCRFLDHQESMTEKALKVIGVYVNTMKRVIINRMANGSNRQDIPMLRSLRNTAIKSEA